MLKLLKKEMWLTASPLSYLFIFFGLMAFLPGYPILVSSFFVCLGLFQSFQSAREANDLTYTMLLPIAKQDAVKARYLFCIVVEGCYFFVTTIPVMLRMSLLSEVAVYRHNPLMNANLVYLGFVLLILGLFNWIFVGGFFKTAYKLGKPFVAFILAAFAVTGLAETLFHIPVFSALNAFGFTHLALQASVLIGGLMAFVLLSAISMHRAIQNFQQIDL